MDLEKLEQRLIATARTDVPSDAVPYAFEKRIMAHLRERIVEDPWTHWARALWRAAAPCVAVTVLLGAWTLLEPAIPASGAASTDFSQEFENTVMAGVVQDSLSPNPAGE